MEPPILTLFKSYLHAIERHDWDGVLALLDDDYEKVVKPSTVGMPVMRKDGVRSHFEQNVGAAVVPGSLKLEIEEIYSVSAECATISALSTATSKHGTPWRMEYMFVIFADAEGTKITREIEVMDPTAAAAFMAKEAEAAAAGSA